MSQPVRLAGQKKWAIGVLHQPHMPGAHVSRDMLAAIVGGHIYFLAFPVTRWAWLDRAHEKNNATLRSSGLDGEFSGEGTGADGHVILPNRSLFFPLGKAKTDGIHVEPARFWLEVGSIDSGRVLDILKAQRFLARLPYEIPGVDPHLFLLAYTGPNEPHRIGDLIDHLLD